MKINDYKTIIFDCDGVLLDSNRIKTESFYKAGLHYGEEAAQQLVNFHTSNGGVSRYEKFRWFLSDVVEEAPEYGLDYLLAFYAENVKASLMKCDLADQLAELRDTLKHQQWLIVSGGDQAELRDVFERRCVSHYFDSGIFGSPASKTEILHREISNGNIKLPALFVGDSRYDYVASSEFSIDFIFLYGWTEFDRWQQFCVENGLVYTEKLSDLLSSDFVLSPSESE